MTILDQFNRVARPSVHLINDPTGKHSSAFFPAPVVPKGIEWPTSKGKPLILLLTLDLKAVAATAGADWLPQTGRLLFFYDMQTWGFEADRSGWRVLYMKEGTPMELRPPFACKEYRTTPVRLAFHHSYPSYGYDEYPKMSSKEEEEYEEWDRKHGVYAGHQIGGFSTPVQNVMEPDMECRRRGINEMMSMPPSIKEDSKRWRLLLQVDSDDEHGTMYGDVGMIYFWIPEIEARAGDFSRVEFEFQCC